MTLAPEYSMRILLDRLNWPVRFVRWRAAQAYAELFSTSHRSTAARVFCEWLQSRQLEMEIVSGLTVLMCAKKSDLPSASDVQQSTAKSSILADVLFQQLYGRPLGPWFDCHSGPAADAFEPDDYFDEHKEQAVPAILLGSLRKLERNSGLPFQNQWAFEWRQIMDATASPYSSYPYHFMNRASGREGVTGQFSRSQCNVYRSAFLRTLACAVDVWGMPPDFAAVVASRTLPLNRGLHSIRPAARPPWLKDIPEQCSLPGASIEELVRSITRIDICTKGMRPVSLSIPIDIETAEFGELVIDGMLVTDDFVPPAPSDDDLTRMLEWPLRDLVSFDGHLPEVEVEKYRVPGKSGSCLPVCLHIWPTPAGFWLNDYFHMGLSLPAPYNFAVPTKVTTHSGRIRMSHGTRVQAKWTTWNDRWSPIHPTEGHTRCAGLTELNEASIQACSAKLGMTLGWQVTLTLWTRKTEYSPPELSTRHAFFRD